MRTGHGAIQRRSRRWALGWSVTTTLISTLVASGAARAGGFQNPYQSATAIGTAFAGASARTDDAGFFFYNPASIAGLRDRQSFFDVRVFAPDVRIEPSRATSPLGASVLADGDSGNIARYALAAGSTTAIPLGAGFVLGVGSSAPFATDVETTANWSGRYHLNKSYMVGLNGTAALAWQASPWLALSAGLQVQRMENRLENTVLIPQGGGPPLETGGFLRASGWATGAVAGAILSPLEGTRIGLAWRSAMTHHMSGRSGANAPGVAVDRVTYDLDLPHTVSVGLEQRLGNDVRLFAEWRWAGWSRFKGFDFSFASGRANERRPIDWQDTSSFAVGLGYRLSPATEVTAGVALDKGAARTGSGTTVSPDSDKVLIGVGLIHDAPGIGRISASYGWLHLRDGEVRASSIASGSLEGRVSGDVHMLGIGYTYMW